MRFLKVITSKAVMNSHLNLILLMVAVTTAGNDESSSVEAPLRFDCV